MLTHPVIAIRIPYSPLAKKVVGQYEDSEGITLQRTASGKAVYLQLYSETPRPVDPTANERLIYNLPRAFWNVPGMTPVILAAEERSLKRDRSDYRSPGAKEAQVVAADDGSPLKAVGRSENPEREGMWIFESMDPIVVAKVGERGLRTDTRDWLLLPNLRKYSMSGTRSDRRWVLYSSEIYFGAYERYESVLAAASSRWECGFDNRSKEDRDAHYARIQRGLNTDQARDPRPYACDRDTGAASYWEVCPVKYGGGHMLAPKPCACAAPHYGKV